MRNARFVGPAALLLAILATGAAAQTGGSTGATSSGGEPTTLTLPNGMTFTYYDRQAPGGHAGETTVTLPDGRTFFYGYETPSISYNEATGAATMRWTSGRIHFLNPDGTSSSSSGGGDPGGAAWTSSGVASPDPVPVPEPEAIGLLAFGTGTLIALRLWRRRRPRNS